MAKKEPLAANKTVLRHKAKGSSSTKGKGNSRKSKPKGNKVSRYKETPAWLHWTLLGVILVVLVVFFYYRFIRPYEYRWLPCKGCKMYGTCIPEGYEVHGIDVSHYQNMIDWSKLKRTRDSKLPINFIFIKATEGGDLCDAAFRQNFDSAHANGFVCGAYHFFNPETDPIKQADFFIKNVNLEEGDLPPVLDVERKGSRGEELLRADVKRWMDRVEKHYGVKPILYTSYKFKTKFLTDSILDSYPYWIAHYYVSSVKYKGQWTFWQHTDVGEIPGISESVDMNVFNGSIEDFVKMTIPRKDTIR